MCYPNASKGSKYQHLGDTGELYIEHLMAGFGSNTQELFYSYSTQISTAGLKVFVLSRHVFIWTGIEPFSEGWTLIYGAVSLVFVEVPVDQIRRYWVESPLWSVGCTLNCFKLSPSDVQAFFNRTKTIPERGFSPRAGWVC